MGFGYTMAHMYWSFFRIVYYKYSLLVGVGNLQIQIQIKIYKRSKVLFSPLPLLISAVTVWVWPPWPRSQGSS